VKKLFLLTGVFWGFGLLLTAQKSKVIGVFQLIEKGKHAEAKGIIEDATKRKGTQHWPRTWYARGLNCQNAYRKGLEKNNKDLYELYPDQLYVAYGSFERTRHLDKRGSYNKRLAPRYVLMANDFRVLGEKHFNNEQYEEALRAFEYTLRIYNSPILNAQPDTNLLYNTALSAYKSGNWNDAIRYLNMLDEKNFSPIVPHLLYAIYLGQSDTASAQNALFQGIQKYKDNEELVLLLANLHCEKKEEEKAIETLNAAFEKDTSNYIFPYTIGLIHQKREEYNKAIDVYKKALDLPGDTVKLLMGIATCYYNIGAELDQVARTITNNYKYLEAKEKSDAAFDSAIKWLEKAYAIDKNNQEVISKMNQFYKLLDKNATIKKPH
jgi:tetratricopeptide (TPR) repeat protein